MIILQGLFNLKEGVSKQEFANSFDEYAEHLSECGFLESWYVAYREPHANYNLNAPEQSGMTVMNFHSLQDANRCWDYVVENLDPVNYLHQAVNTKVTDISFFLSNPFDVKNKSL